MGLEVAILQDNGWAVTNNADLSARGVQEGDKWIKLRQIRCNDVFVSEGILKHGSKIGVAVKDKEKAYEGTVTGLQDIEGSDSIIDFLEITVNKEIEYNILINKIKRRIK